VSATCIEHLRENDVFGRLGGEEFGILLTETDGEGARKAAEKLRNTIEHQTVEVLGGLGVTSSFGVARLDRSILKPEDWIGAADQALYAAKHAGRNRCVVAGEPSKAIAA
jgi:diguanylate cyclase (GGDEF)-like protein